MTRSASMPGEAYLFRVMPAPKYAELPRFGVVIPYFQHQVGLLHRALNSIRAQEYRPVQVVVVDDGSPRPAAEEITTTLRNAVPELTVIRQANQGVAAARNAALDALGEDVSAIAFLDSDDYWDPAHLRNAAVALSRGADFYFANLRIEGTTTDWFRKRSRLDLLDNPRPVPEAPGIMQWAGSVPELLGFARCPVLTSGVVFRRAIMPRVRFARTLRGVVGEGYRVWWALLMGSSGIMYCPEPTVTYGADGLGISQHAAVEWGSVRHLARLADDLGSLRHVCNNYPMSPAERRLLREPIGRLRQTALLCALHSLRRRPKNALKEIMYMWRADPMCAAFWCVALPKLLYTKLHRAPV